MKFLNVLMDTVSFTIGDTNETDTNCVVIPVETIDHELFSRIENGITPIYDINEDLVCIPVSRMIRELKRLERWEVLIEEAKRVKL